jgi:hypothetical protein
MSKYYVYTLAYPGSMDGAVFYVGKGSGNRIDLHEVAAAGKLYDANQHKCDVEQDAYLYEWVLIYLVYGVESLTNMAIMPVENQTEFSFLRVWKQTLSSLRILAALRGEPRLSVLDELVTRELERASL